MAFNIRKVFGRQSAGDSSATATQEPADDGGPSAETDQRAGSVPWQKARSSQSKDRQSQEGDPTGVAADGAPEGVVQYNESDLHFERAAGGGGADPQATGPVRLDPTPGRLAEAGGDDGSIEGATNNNSKSNNLSTAEADTGDLDEDVTLDEGRLMRGLKSKTYDQKTNDRGDRLAPEEDGPDAGGGGIPSPASDPAAAEVDQAEGRSIPENSVDVSGGDAGAPLEHIAVSDSGSVGIKTPPKIKREGDPGDPSDDDADGDDIADRVGVRGGGVRVHSNMAAREADTSAGGGVGDASGIAVSDPGMPAEKPTSSTTGDPRDDDTDGADIAGRIGGGSGVGKPSIRREGDPADDDADGADIADRVGVRGGGIRFHSNMAARESDPSAGGGVGDPSGIAVNDSGMPPERPSSSTTRREGDPTDDDADGDDIAGRVGVRGWDPDKKEALGADAGSGASDESAGRLQASVVGSADRVGVNDADGLELSRTAWHDSVTTGRSSGKAVGEKDHGAQVAADNENGERTAGHEAAHTVQQGAGGPPVAAREAGSGKAAGEKDHGAQVTAEEARTAPSYDVKKAEGTKREAAASEGGSGQQDDNSIAVSDDGGPQLASEERHKTWLTSNFVRRDDDDEGPSTLLDLSAGSAEGAGGVADLDLDGLPDASGIDLDADVDSDTADLEELMADA